MDNLKSLLTDIGDRYRNPFITSFCISWLLFNWPISILLIHFFTDSNSQLQFNEVKDKIGEMYTICKGFWYPILSALIYVFLFPLFSNVIAFAQAYFLKLKNKWVENASKDGVVSINKYLELKNQYTSKLEQLKRVIESESQYLEQNNKLLQQINDEKVNTNEQYQKYFNLVEMYEPRMIQGMWKISFSKAKRDIPMLIQGGRNIRLSINHLEISSSFVKLFTQDLREPYGQGFITVFKYSKELDSNGNEEFPIFIFAEMNQINHNIGPPPQSNSRLIPFYFVFKLRQTKKFRHLYGLLNDTIEVELTKLDDNQ